MLGPSGGQTDVSRQKINANVGHLRLILSAKSFGSPPARKWTW